jgi:hypothetical protein
MGRRAASVLSMRRFSLLLLSIASVPSTAVHAQVREPEIPPGARVRVSAPALSQRAVIGRYEGLNADSLSLMPVRTGSLMRIPLSQISRLELSDGRNRAGGATVGALLGFGVSVAGGFLCLAVCPTSPGSGANLAPVGGLFLGIFVGLPVGGAIGATVFARERWRPIPAPPEADR